MLHKVFHGSRHKNLKLSHSLMYASRDVKVAVSYAENRYVTEVTYVHRIIFDIKNPASGDDVTAALVASGGEPNDMLSEAHALTYERVLLNLKRKGYDGAVDVWDFAFDGPDEIAVLAVFDAFNQVELVDSEPFMTLERRSRR